MESSCRLNNSCQNSSEVPTATNLDNSNTDHVNIPVLPDLESLPKENIEYIGEQNHSFIIHSKDTISLNSNQSSDIDLEFIPRSSKFVLDSTMNNGSISWVNGLEPGSGEVQVQNNLSEEIPFFRFLFSDNNDSPISGITNENFKDCINPSILNYSTYFSFEFSNLNLTSEISNSLHSVALELRFNNGSINFLLSDNGSSLGLPVGENIYKPSSNSLYINFNHTNNNQWKEFSFNITKLIETYFLRSEYNQFANITSLYLYSFTFAEEYNFTLDLRKVNYTTFLPHDNQFKYYINNSFVGSYTGSFLYENTSKNIDLRI